MRIRSYLLLSLALLILSGCGAIRSAETSLTYLTIPPSAETRLGTDYASQIAKEVVIIDDPVAQAWLDRVGQSLVANSPETKQVFIFRLVKDDVVNAFAIPGGFCYVQTGLLRLADNEAQVASVIGHEINHVTRRHGIRSMQRNLGVEAVSFIASLADPTVGAAVNIINSSGGVLAMRKFGRDDEREADKYGVEALYGAGYDPREAARFFEKLHAWQEENGMAGAGVLSSIASTHPATLERIENIHKQVELYDLTVPMETDTEEFHQVKRRLGLE